MYACYSVQIYTKCYYYDLSHSLAVTSTQTYTYININTRSLFRKYDLCLTLECLPHFCKSTSISTPLPVIRIHSYASQEVSARLHSLAQSIRFTHECQLYLTVYLAVLYTVCIKVVYLHIYLFQR